MQLHKSLWEIIKQYPEYLFGVLSILIPIIFGVKIVIAVLMGILYFVLCKGRRRMKASHFKDLLKSIDEARAIKAGKLKPSRVIHFEPLQLKSIRRKLHVSQSQFADLIGVSSPTLRNWEQGRTYPDGAARALLVVAAKNPAVVLQALRAA